MNKLKWMLAVMVLMCTITASAQNTVGEKYGKTLNLGLGVGYYKYVGYSTPVFHANLELDVAKNFTLAPFLTYYNYKNEYYWGGSNKPYKYYKYSETVMPVGVKGTYYFDGLVAAKSKWDFYLAGSLGFVFRQRTWEEDYEGSQDIDQGVGPLYLDLHVGTEYHINQKAGIFLDVSTGLSTAGVAIHL